MDSTYLPRTVLLTVLVSAGGAALTLACGGRVEPSSRTGSGQSAAQGERADDESNAGSVPAQAPASECEYLPGGGSSGASGGVAQCMTSTVARCADGEKTITCECSTKIGSGVWGGGSCTCGSTTFEFDCKNACQIGEAEYAKCGMRPPPPSPGSESGSSSSSGSSGSSTSSSGG